MVFDLQAFREVEETKPRIKVLVGEFGSGKTELTVNLASYMQRAGMTAEQAAGSPHALCGTLDQIADDLEERRERFGISAIGLSASSLDDLAPLISRLAGT